MPIGVVSYPLVRSWLLHRGDRDASTISFSGAPFDPTGCSAAVRIYDPTGAAVVTLGLTASADGQLAFVTDANGYTTLTVLLEPAGSVIPQIGTAYTFDAVLTLSDGTPLTIVRGSLVLS